MLWACSLTMYGQTVSLLSDPARIVPIGNLVEHKIMVVTPDENLFSPFITQINRYAEIETTDYAGYENDTKYYNTIIIAGTNRDLLSGFLAMARQSVVNNKRVIVCRFDEQAVNWSTATLRGATVLSISGTSAEAQESAAMSLFGGMTIAAGAGTRGNGKTRLGYRNDRPSHLNLAKMQRKIDQIAEEAISQQAAPGMVVMAVHNGEVIFEKAYGHHTYEKDRSTRVDDIFDLASVSKIAATTPVTMRLYDQGIIHLDSTMGHYLWQSKNTNKANTTLRSVLLHEGGFTPYIPFYRELKKDDFARTKTASHEVQLADGAFLRTGYYEQIMWPRMLQSSIKDAGKYVYSDISMYVMKEVAEQETSMPMQDYVGNFLYRPIGMKTTGFNPRNRFPKDRIVPTEHDTTFRKVLLQGFVHDQGAAMAGGIAGHAGLFASANDLAIYGQMLLNRGRYGGVQFFKPETVDLFTSRQSQSSRRGLGFDRYDPDPAKKYPSDLANESVYGHTGYTGTCIWIDPQHQLVYIFLSNRVHPQVSTKLLSLNIRSRIQDVIYEVINEAK